MRKKVFKNRAFTLVELLAVIVILAVILMVAVPNIINVIEQAKKDSFASSVKGLVKAAENEFYFDLTTKTRNTTTYEFLDNQLVTGTLDFSGKAPEKGFITVDESGLVSLKLYNEKWCAIKNNNEIIINEITSETCADDIPQEEPYIATDSEYFVFNSATGTITGFHPNGINSDLPAISELNVPYIIDGVDVTSFSAWSMSGLEFNKVTIPGSIGTVAEGTFHYTMMEELIIHEGVENILSSAFYTGATIKKLVLPSTLKTVGDLAFYQMVLTDPVMVLPNGLVSIGDGAFSDSRLTDVTIPSSVTSIGTDAFVDYGDGLGNDAVIIRGTASSAANTYATAHGHTFIAE